MENKALEINRILKQKYPTPKSALNWNTPWQMLVAAIFSAQVNDNQVNKVTDELFLKYPDVNSMVKAKIEDVLKITKSLNYYKNKTKFVKENAKIIKSKFKGEVPKNMEELLTLKGIGRKVANVIIGDVFNKPVGIVVDTHVKRVSKRLGLTENIDPEKIEKDLVKLFPRAEWVNISHRLIFHGREICIARNPKCEICPLKDLCDYYINFEKNI